MSKKKTWIFLPYGNWEWNGKKISDVQDFTAFSATDTNFKTNRDEN